MNYSCDYFIIVVVVVVVVVCDSFFFHHCRREEECRFGMIIYSWEEVGRTHHALYCGAYSPSRLCL